MTEKRRSWPFQGDAPVVRARKAALAYRQTAQQLQGEIIEMLQTIAAVDPRILGWIEDSRMDTLHKAAVHLGDRSDAVKELDERLWSWGEEWHVEKIERTYDDPEELITAAEAAQILSVVANTVNTHRMRGRITGKWIETKGDRGRWYYKVKDVWALSTNPRTRDSRAGGTTDSLPSSGSSDAE